MRYILKTIWYIHGAASTPLSFNWMKPKLNEHIAVDIEYENETPLEDTINKLRVRAANCANPPIIIGHSLGGIIAASIAQMVPVEKVVSLASPFGGSFAASLMRWFLPSQLFRDISQQSAVLYSLRRTKLIVPMLSFVTDSNLTIMGEKTDGVVTVSSQKALDGPTYITVPYNHFEVLLASDVAHKINSFIF